MLTDSHAHLTMFTAGSDRETVMQNAEKAGIGRILTIGTTLEDSQQCLDIARQYPQVLATAGVHPHEVKDVELAACLDTLKALAKDELVVAIGEIGLDFYYNLSPKDMQQEFFRRQLELALELHLPVVIHDRDAHDETLSIVEDVDVSSVGGIFHCFSGDLTMAERVRELGFLISIAGPVTFKKPGHLPEIAARLPLESLLIETDCPYLAPVPFRGKRNEPAYVRYTAKKVAEFRGISLDEVTERTSQNFVDLFRR
ncbi:hydrolase TatD [candidate division KSB3 bacterium]|uniref:Hydrolase TatD n=1 Tax=candidate division KSB3 bacterium TaxID=2044937 RepID=A0A2G6KIN7_9BACT|nr:MAG: hydrolase TatD [candidate division KSB3 bacterium]